MQDLDATLTSATQWLQGWQTLGPILSTPHLRKRFIGTCLVEGPQAAWRSAFETGFPKLKSWRWGSVVQVLEQLLPAEMGIRLCWNAAKFSAKQGSEETALDETRDAFAFKDLPAITKVVQDSEWWLHGHMLYHLHCVGRSLQQWAEGCECHGPDVQHTLRSADMRILELVPSCPMAGKRALYLAKGVRPLLARLAGPVDNLRQRLLKSVSNDGNASLGTAVGRLPVRA